MNPSRRVKKFEENTPAKTEKLDQLKEIEKKKLNRKVKIKLRPNGNFDVISYDIVKKDEEVE